MFMPIDSEYCIIDCMANSRPIHVGIIMDGNRRWAARNGMRVDEGHKEGAKNFERIVKAAKDLGVVYLTVYALSTENFKSRSSVEIKILFDLMKKVLDEKKVGFEKERINLKFIGNLSKLPADLAKDLKNLENKIPEKNSLTVIVAVNYGGREEIVSSVEKIANKKLEISEENISNNLYTQGLPDPDLIIRTGGHKRLSNFLLWQGAYSELYFTDTLWPDFGEKEFKKALDDFKERVRNFGR
jgi:undecaprenyl diphosphate synthase